METDGNSTIDKRLPYGEIYRIIDKLTGCTYIGQHKYLKTDYTDGGLGWRQYMSSSTIITSLANENDCDYSRFIKQHVEWCWSSSELADEEEKLIKLEKQEGHGEYNRQCIRCDYSVIQKHKLDGMTAYGVQFHSASEANKVKEIIEEHGQEMISSYENDKTMTVKQLISIYPISEINQRLLSKAYAGWLRENGAIIRRGRVRGSSQTRMTIEQQEDEITNTLSGPTMDNTSTNTVLETGMNLSSVLLSKITAFNVSTGEFEYDNAGIPLHSRKPGIEAIFKKITPSRLVERYQSGESAAVLSREYGVKCVNTMITALKIAGAEVRDLSSAVSESWRDRKIVTRMIKCPVCGRESERRWDRLTCGDRRCTGRLVNAPEFREAYVSALTAREEWKMEYLEKDTRVE